VGELNEKSARAAAARECGLEAEPPGSSCPPLIVILRLAETEADRTRSAAAGGAQQRQVGADAASAALRACRAHAEGCPHCSAALEQARAQRRFLDEVAPLLRGGSSEPTSSQSEAAEAVGARRHPAGSQQAHGDASGLDADSTLLHGYRLVEPIGQGGQGSVWRAVHEPSGRPAAIKIVRFANAQQRARMRREAALAARLRHPGLVTIFDCGALPDAGFAIAMELVDGEPLDVWASAVDRCGQSPAQRVRRKIRALSAVCAAVHHAHQYGVIHRDLKPGNILLGKDDQPRVVDFGLARAASADSGQTLTRVGEFAGTLAYAAPEHLAAAEPVGTAADVYSLGAVLYQLLSGRPPIELPSSLEQAVVVLRHSDPPAIRRAIDGSAIERDLLTIAMKALSRDPLRRYDSAAALRADLERWLAGAPVEARRDSSVYLLRMFLRRHRVAALAAAVALATLVAFSALVTHLYLQADDAQRRFQRLFEGAQASAAQREQVYRQAELSLAELSALFAEERNRRWELALEGRRLGSEMALMALARARELFAQGEVDAARTLAWREALAPSMPAPGVARVGSGRLDAALAVLRELYSEDAASTGVAHVDELIAADIDAWVARLETAGVATTNVQALCAWRSARLGE
jgi:hypothetical protein